MVSDSLTLLIAGKISQSLSLFIRSPKNTFNVIFWIFLDNFFTGVKLSGKMKKIGGHFEICGFCRADWRFSRSMCSVAIS